MLKKYILAVLLAVVSTFTVAKEYKIYVPNAAGSGAGDTMARKISEIYAKRNNGNSLVVHNVPGGSHVLAVNEFKKQSLALIVSTGSIHVYNYLQPEPLPYSDADFNVLAELGEILMFYFTYPGSGIDNIKDLISAPSNKPLLIGSHANNTLININSLRKNLGAQVDAVPFKNPQDMISNVMGKHLMVGLATGSGNLFELAETGKIKVLGSSGQQPLKVKGMTIPSVPTVLKVPQWNGFHWISISPGSSAEHVQLAKDISEIISSKEFLDILPSLILFQSDSKEPPITVIQRMRNSLLKHRDLLGTP